MASTKRSALVPTDQAIGDRMTAGSRRRGKSPARGGNTAPPAKSRKSAPAPKR